MATIKGTVQVLGMLSPTDTRDKYPTHEDTYGKGGFRTIDTFINLEKIPTERRKEGMIVYVLETKQYFQLVGGIENEHFIEAKFGEAKKGGFVNVDYLSDIALIPEEERKEGMIVYVLETKQYFQLIGGLTNEFFIPFEFGAPSTPIDPNEPNEVAGDTSYLRLNPTTVSVGGAPIGTTFSGTLQDALDKILYPYVSPTFQTFYIDGLSTKFEVGKVINPGEYTFIWSYSNNNIQENSIIIYDIDSSVIVANNGITPTNYKGVIKEVNFNIKKSISWKIIGKNSKGMNFEKLFTISSDYYYYFGNGVGTITGTQIKGLTGSSLDGTVINKSITFPSTGYKWLCIPSDFIQPTKFIDEDTGFQVAMELPIIVEVVNSFSIPTNYKCYRTTNELMSSLKIKIT